MFHRTFVSKTWTRLQLPLDHARNTAKYSERYIWCFFSFGIEIVFLFCFIAVTAKLMKPIFHLVFSFLDTVSFFRERSDMVVKDKQQNLVETTTGWRKSEVQKASTETTKITPCLGSLLIFTAAITKTLLCTIFEERCLLKSSCQMQ